MGSTRASDEVLERRAEMSARAEDEGCTSAYMLGDSGSGVGRRGAEERAEKGPL